MANGLGAGPQDFSLMFFPIFAVFGSLGWLMIFLETYRHLDPKMMSKEERITYSATQATVMTVMLGAVSYFALQYLMAEVLK